MAISGQTGMSLAPVRTDCLATAAMTSSLERVEMILSSLAPVQAISLTMEAAMAPFLMTLRRLSQQIRRLSSHPAQIRGPFPHCLPAWTITAAGGSLQALLQGLVLV